MGELRGVEFENWLAKKFSGFGSFKKSGREFDGGVGNRWFEAKSGRYWEDHAQPGKGFDKFKSDMGSRQRIAAENGATVDIHSHSPIAEHVKDRLIKEGTAFTEHY